MSRRQHVPNKRCALNNEFAPDNPILRYLATIVRAHHNFKGLGWVVCDTAYCRQATARKDLNWVNIDTPLYNTLFTGRVRVTPRCMHCLSLEHLPERCPLVNGPFSQMLQSAGMPPMVQSTTTIGTYLAPPRQQMQNTAVGCTMQIAVHAAPFTSVALCTSVQNVSRITLGHTAPHASSCSGEANSQ